MSSCELCGRLGQIVTAEVEGVELKVCQLCAKHGTIIRQTQQRNTFIRQPIKKAEPEYRIVDNYAGLIRAVREKKALSQADFAKFLNEKESVVAHWEAGSVKPGIEEARRLEAKLGITFIILDEVSSVKLDSQRKGDELTLGDFVKIRKRK